MGELVQQALAGLRDKQALQDNSNDAIWHASDLLNRFTTNDGFKSGFAEIDAEPITADDAANLERALCEALRKCDDLSTRGSLLYALQKSRNPQLRDFYVSELKRALHLVESANLVVHACSGALELLGEQVYEWKDGATSQGSGDIGKNARQARNYLKRLAPDDVPAFGSKFPD